MKNLTNLIKLQYYSVLSLKKYLLLVLVLGFIMILQDPTFFLFPAALMLMALTYSSATFEEKSKINYLIYSLPIREKDYILSKFLFGLLNTLLAIILCSLLYFVCNIINPAFNGIPLSAVILSILFIGIFLTCIVVPVGLVIGFEKSRIIMVFLAVFPVCMSSELLNFLPKISDIFSPITLNIFIVLTAVTIILASYFITTNIYSKKDIA